VNYDCAWEWQSRVEVVIGEPMTLTLDAVSTDELAAADRSVGADRHQRGYGAELRLLERVAFAATCVSVQSYSQCLKHFDQYLREIRETDARCRLPTLRRTHIKVPLLPRHGMASARANGDCPRHRLLPSGNASGHCGCHRGEATGRYDRDRLLANRDRAPSAALVSRFGLRTDLVRACVLGERILVSACSACACRRFRMLSVALYNGFFASIRGPVARTMKRVPIAGACRG
jgi:hypothetical protein